MTNIYADDQELCSFPIDLKSLYCQNREHLVITEKNSTQKSTFTCSTLTSTMTRKNAHKWSSHDEHTWRIWKKKIECDSSLSLSSNVLHNIQTHRISSQRFHKYNIVSWPWCYDHLVIKMRFWFSNEKVNHTRTLTGWNEPDSLIVVLSPACSDQFWSLFIQLKLLYPRLINNSCSTTVYLAEVATECSINSSFIHTEFALMKNQSHIIT